MGSIALGIFALIALASCALCLMLAMRYPVIVPAVLTILHLGVGAFGISIPYRGETFLGIAILVGVMLRRGTTLPQAFAKVWALGLLSVFATISYFLNSSQLSFGVAQVSRGLISILWEIFCLCVVCYIIPLSQLRHFWKQFEVVAAASAVVVSVVLIYEILRGSQSFDLNVLRLGLGNSHPATLGYLSAVLSLILAHSVSARRRAMPSVLVGIIWTGLACSVGNLYLSQTRGAWMGFGLGFSAEAIINRHWLKAAMFAGVLGLGLLAPTTTARFSVELASVDVGRPETWLNAGSGRSFFWGHIFRTAQTVPPIWGGGLGTAIQSTTLNRELLGYFGNAEYVLVHNDVLMFYTDLGIAGVFLYCSALFLPLLRRHSPLLISLAPCVVIGSLLDNLAVMVVPLEYVLISAIILTRLMAYRTTTGSATPNHRATLGLPVGPVCPDLLAERPCPDVTHASVCRNILAGRTRA